MTTNPAPQKVLTEIFWTEQENKSIHNPTGKKIMLTRIIGKQKRKKKGKPHYKLNKWQELIPTFQQ